jgi:dolichyl-phosphate-mannose--protein O-mannosyl transferase
MLQDEAENQMLCVSCENMKDKNPRIQFDEYFHARTTRAIVWKWIAASVGFVIASFLFWIAEHHTISAAFGFSGFVMMVCALNDGVFTIGNDLSKPRDA